MRITIQSEKDGITGLYLVTLKISNGNKYYAFYHNKPDPEIVVEDFYEAGESAFIQVN